MRAAERQIKIQEFIRTQEFIDAAALASQLKVSESSIRRDLIELARQGLVRKVRVAPSQCWRATSREVSWHGHRIGPKRKSSGLARRPLRYWKTVRH